MTGDWHKDFEILDTEVHGHRLAYLDNAATTQMPRQVVERISRYYVCEHANVHRGIHYLSERATSEVERARAHVASFVGARESEEVIFTSGATEALNLVAQGLLPSLPAGSAIVVSDLEHHSNFVPWQRVCETEGVEFLIWRSTDGRLATEDLSRLLSEHDVRVIAVTQVSNVTGTVTPLEEVVSLAHQHGALVVVDGAQGILHEGVDVSSLDVDFYVFSAHKMTGPTGLGVLYGRRELLERLEPSRFGGGMVDEVLDRRTTFGALPYRLEAGTPNIAGIVGFDAALGYLGEAGLDDVRQYERELMAYAMGRLEELGGVKILGHPEKRGALVSFNLDGMPAFDVAFMLDKLGVAVRSGHHCAQPALRSLGVDTCVRASVAFYNEERDIDALCDGLERLGMLRR